MKLKEINRTAIQAWSPAQHHPVYLAAGTSAQQLDATFSTNASLEIFELDLSDPALAMKSCGVFTSPQRYHKLVWGAHGIDTQGSPSGVLIAGGENGNIILYDPSKIIAGDSEVVIAQSDKHTGPVRALDVNSFQTNLVASGGNESEIYIWDLNSFASPMTPGPKTQPLEDISCVAWNRQVQHILASASPSGRASVWDLRKNDLIIKVSDHSNRMHCSGLAWNPDVATQLVLASEDDRMPVIQMWDLRFATSPLKVLENHTRGVLAIAWSLADPELLLSCGKDNRILCWNPNTAEVLYELPTSTQWCFDIQWCPRNPAVLSAAAFDGHISIYSIMGGSNDVPSATQADQINASFGNMDPFGTGQALPPLQMAQPTTTKSTITPLKKPPKWIRRPVGASFAFGGKLVSLENIQPPPQQPQQRTAHIVHVSQVVTETAFLDRSDKLQATLNAGSFVEFCQTKIEAAQNEFDKTVWSFLKVNFENDARGKYLELLGYKKEELALKISAALEGKIEMSAEVSEPSSAAAPAPEPSPDAETAPAPEPEPPAAAQPELPLEPAAAQPVAQPVPELRPPPPAGSQPPGQPIPEPVLLHDPEPVLDLKTEPDVLAHAEPLADVTPPSDLTPPVDLTSAFDLTPPVELAPPVDLQSMPAFVPSIPEPAPELIPQADHLQSVPLFTPHGGLQQSVSADFDMTSVIQPVPEAAPNVDLLQSVPLFVPPVTLQSFPELAPPTNLQQVFSQQAPPTDAATSMPVLVPPADAQQQSVPVMGLVPTDALQSIPGMDLMPDLNSAPDVLAPVAPQLVPEFLPQVHPPDFPAFMPSVDALQPKTDFDLSALVGTEPMVDLTPLVTPLDLQFEVDSAATVEVQPESQLGLAVEPIVDHATENSLMPAASAGPSAEAFEEEIALEEVEENGPVEDNVASPPEESPAPEETPSAGEAIAPDDTAVPEELPLVEESLCPAQTPLSVAEAFGLEQTLAPEEFAAPEESPAVLEEPPAPATKTVDLRVSQDIDGLITQALLTGDFESAVDLCLHDNRMADSIILAIAGGPELLEKTQRKYLTKTQSKVSKLISAVVTKDWTEVLETCNLQNWKEALAAVMTYAKPEEFSSLCGLLGSRLEAAEDPALQAQACLCYICAGSVEQLVACWTKAQDSHCPLALQDLVEKVVVLRQAVEQTRGGTAPSVGALLAEKMSQYASLLASQGSLQTAISYLPNNTDQAVVQQLRERLRRALGQEEAVAPAAPAPAAAPAVTPVVTAAAVAQNAQPAVPAATPVQAYASAPAQPQQIPSQPAPAAAAPPTPQYYQQFRSASTVTSWSNQTPTALPSVPRPLGPVPDVQNEPLPPAYGFQPPASAAPPSSSGYLVSQQYQPYPQVQQYMPGAGGPAVFQPLSYSSTAPCFPPQSISSAPVPLYPSPYMNHSAASSYPASPPVFHGPPPVGQPSASAPLPTPLSASNFSPPSLSSGVTFQHGGPGSPTSYLPPPPLGPSGPQNGWNDPPSLSRVPKKKKVPDHFTPPAPITAPIMAPLGEPQAQTVPMQPPQQFPGQPGGPAPFSPIQQQPLNPLDTNPAMPKMNVEGAPGAPIGDVIQPVQSLPAEKITKKPIPDEHLILKTTFEGLIQKCLAAAADPQTKRKLDDANKRLDFLYDKLRDQTLSPAIVTGLHNIAHSIETRSYMEGLSMHTHIVSNSNFSETSAFMPVLKVVLTQANKLGV